MLEIKKLCNYIIMISVATFKIVKGLLFLHFKILLTQISDKSSHKLLTVRLVCLTNLFINT